MKIIAVLAMDQHLLIGDHNKLPWHIPEDMKHFKEITDGDIVVMGKNTYFSFPPKFRPLPNRRNIVVTRETIDGIETYQSIDTFLESMKSENIQKCFLIGGASLYDQFFELGLVDEVELTLLDGVYEGDIFIKEWRQDFEIIKSVDFANGKFISLKKKNLI